MVVFARQRRDAAYFFVYFVVFVMWEQFAKKAMQKGEEV